MIVVGLSGYKQAGKDSVADILVRDYGFIKMAFADPIKEMVRDLDPLVGYSNVSGEYCEADCPDCNVQEPMYLSDLYGYGWTDQMIKDSEFGDEVRRIWQRFGTEVMRDQDAEYWVSRAEGRLQASDADRVVFTDVRFENEADMIYGLRNTYWNGNEWTESGNHSSVWRIHREPEPGRPRDVHESEQMIGMLGEEVTILNKGTLKDLQEPVEIAIEMLLNKVYPGQQQFDFLLDGME